MTANIDKTHWLERSAEREGHWDQSPWPAQLAQGESDTEQEEDDEHRRQLDRWQLRQRATKGHHTTPSSSVIHRAPLMSASFHQALYESSNTSSDVPREGIARRHHRAKSTPEPSHNLHIDTILPLQLPPPNPCTTWWTEQQDSLRRSDSTASFLSARSDGSWHGDHGDEDPNGQLERAISQLSRPTTARSSSINSIGKQKADDGLILSTYDYDYDDDDDDDGFAQRPGVFDTEAAIDDQEAEAIRSHAGVLINNVASFFLEGGTTTPSSRCNDGSGASSSRSTALAHPAVLARSISDRAMHGNISSLDELTLESDMIHRQRRHRAATVLSQSERQEEEGDSSPNSMQLLWRWFVPDVDDQMQKELFGSHSPSSRQRLDSIPSLYSDASETETEGDSDEDSPFTPRPMHNHCRFSMEQAPLYAYTAKGKHSMVYKEYKKSALSLLATSNSPSPLWDNRLDEQPYRRSWSSVLNLPAL